MTNQELANLIYPSLPHTPEDYEAMYPERDLPEGAMVTRLGPSPTGFVRRLGIWDILLPRTPRDLLLHFHGPCLVWVEGTAPLNPRFARHPFNPTSRRAYGV